MFRSAITAAITAAVLLTPMPLAHADPRDDGYLKAIRALGIIDPDGDAHLVRAGLTVCDALEGGESATSAERHLREGNPLVITATVAAGVIAASETYYCPDQLPKGSQAWW